MKKLLKTLGISLLMIVLMSTFVFAEDLQEIDLYGEYDSATFSQAAQSYHSQIDVATDDEYAEFLTYFAETPDILQGFESYEGIRASEGAFISYGPYSLYQTTEGTARVYQLMEYTDGFYVMVCGFDSTLTFDYLQFYEVKNLKAGDAMPATFSLDEIDLKEVSGGSPFKLVFDGEVLKGALVNTLIGLGVVFAVLILFTIIIGLFKYISPEGRAYKEKIESLESNNGAVTNGSGASVDNEMIAAITAAVVTDETQLVAAITAAICAYEGVSSDSFVVKTIKKRKW